jgi:rsbT co-antagonist protein RsbR
MLMRMNRIRPTRPASATESVPSGGELKRKERRAETNDAPTLGDNNAALLRELVAHLRQNRTQLREEWATRIAKRSCSRR